MKRRVAWIIAALSAVAVLAGGALAVNGYYRDRFKIGTFVNGVYCTGKSVEEINRELTELYSQDTLLLMDAEDREYTISLSSVCFNVDYTSQLQELLEVQGGETASEDGAVAPQVTFNEEALRQEIAKCGIVADNAREQTVRIYRDKGYCLYDGMRDVFDEEAAVNVVAEALRQENFTVDLGECYRDLAYTEEMKNTLALWKKVDAFQTCGIVYDMGDSQIALTPQIVSEWILTGEDGSFTLDENGELILREDGVDAFIEELCAAYDTVGAPRLFHATRGEDVTVEGGIYGSTLDKNAESAYLKAAFAEGVSEVHIPAYTQCAYVRGADDIGDTYVEVDMKEQKLYYYEKGELLFETDVVTGNTGRKWGTPSGVNYVYAKQKNRILRGRDYASHVKFWVPVKGNIGIHDASWRKDFGGEIYKKNGSHGCINVPKERMEELYGYLEIGVPVVMFY